MAQGFHQPEQLSQPGAVEARTEFFFIRSQSRVIHVHATNDPQISPSFPFPAARNSPFDLASISRIGDGRPREGRERGFESVAQRRRSR